jgi:hypothetical protein
LMREDVLCAYRQYGESATPRIINEGGCLVNCLKKISHIIDTGVVDSAFR